MYAKQTFFLKKHGTSDTNNTAKKHTERIKITGERDSNAYKKRLKDKNMIPSLQGIKKLAFYFLFFWLWSRCWTQSNKSSSFRSGFLLWRNISALVPGMARVVSHCITMSWSCRYCCCAWINGRAISYCITIIIIITLHSFHERAPKNSILWNWILEPTAHKNIK